LRGSSGALVVADASRIDTIERLPEHIQLFSSVNPQGFIIVVLNKSDLVNQEELTQRVQRVQLKKWERVLGIYQISAKTGSSVDEIFQQLACRSLESL
jgi:50S ribosomal subunit-associated GTPase HflX